MLLIINSSDTCIFPVIVKVGEKKSIIDVFKNMTSAEYVPLLKIQFLEFKNIFADF